MNRAGSGYREGAHKGRMSDFYIGRLDRRENISREDKLRKRDVDEGREGEIEAVSFDVRRSEGPSCAGAKAPREIGRCPGVEFGWRPFRRWRAHASSGINHDHARRR